MVIIVIVVAVIAAVLLFLGSIYWLPRLARQREASNLNRFLQDENCQWARAGAPAAGGGPEGDVYHNSAPVSQGIEMRVYSYAEPADGSKGDDEGICLSIIDRSNLNGMILNGFALHLEAMQFGDTLWNEQFLGDTGIMERMITEKRVAWDQMQQEIIVGHYALFM